MLYAETMASVCNNRMKRTNTLCGQHAGMVVVNPVVSTLTIGLEGENLF
jgi:hypothetical protein